MPRRKLITKSKKIIKSKNSISLEREITITPCTEYDDEDHSDPINDSHLDNLQDLLSTGFPKKTDVDNMASLP